MKYMTFYLCFIVKDLIGVPCYIFFSRIKECADDDNMFFKTYKKFDLKEKS